MTRKYRSKVQHKTLLNAIDEAKSLYDRNLLTDFTLKCEEEEFAVHKVILAVNCPYFRDYLIQEENLFLESMSIDFMTSEVLQIILSYFYSGRISIDREQTPSLLKSIIEASSVLQIPLLSHYCLELLVNKPEREISVSEWKVIEEVDSQVTFNIFLESVVKKLASLNTSSYFLDLSDHQLKELFQSPAIAEVDQNTVFQSILNWVKHDLEGRKEQLTEFLESFVDFERLNIAILSKLQKEHWLIKNKYFVKSYAKIASKQLKRDAQESTKQTSLITRHIEEVHVKVKTADCVQHINSIDNDDLYLKKSMPKLQFFVYDNQNRESRIFLYDYLKDKLDLMIAHPLLNTEDAGSVYHQGKIYIFGGKRFQYRKTYNNVYSYNLKTKQWMLKPLMLNCRSGPAAAVFNGYIYVIGGKDTASQCMKCVEYFDPAIDEWTTVGNLPVDVNQTVSVVVAKDSLYALINSELYEYDELDYEWLLQETELSKNLNGKRGVVHMCNGNDKIFIIEKSAPQCVWIYDPEDNTVKEDIIPTVLTECDGILNLENPHSLEFLVSGNKRWFIYRPVLHSWSPFDPKQLKDIQTLTLLSAFH